MKPIKIILSPEAEEAYDYLEHESKDSKVEKTIFESAKKKIALIKSNPHYGSPIAKNLIPKEYILKYGVNNLFHVELSSFWRMLYTLTNDEKEIEIIAFVLDIIDHNKYDKKFGYKRR